MDRTSGLKECPRCGLRNRHGASQCDFCGWDFKEASDDWLGKVSDLENLGKEAGSDGIDRTTVSKIELTMTKPADAPIWEKAAEASEPTEVPLPTVPSEEREDVVTATTEEPFAPVEDAPILTPESEEAAKPVEETAACAEPVVEEIDVPPQKEEARIEPENSGTASEPTATPGQDLRSTYLIMGIGAGLYAVDIVLATSHLIDKVLGWVAIIVASAMIALSVMRRLAVPSLRERDEEEVFLCPVCHEVVGETEPNCPSCGAKFQEPLADGGNA